MADTYKFKVKMLADITVEREFESQEEAQNWADSNVHEAVAEGTIENVRFSDSFMMTNMSIDGAQEITVGPLSDEIVEADKTLGVIE